MAEEAARTMRVVVDGLLLPNAVTAKDVILAIISKIGVGGATGLAVEYTGSTIRAMSMEGQLTICNMSIEAGARIGMIGPDETTFSFLHGRRYAPKGGEWERALAYWKALPTDSDARFDREISFDAARLAPMVSWGTSPEDCSPVDGVVPDPSEIGDSDRRRHVERALDYMKLTPATSLQQVTIDRVFIGSCTNGRIEDLRAAAKVLKGRKASVPGMVSPGSHGVKRQAEAEGLQRIFPGCRAGVARTRLLHVQRFERRAGCPGERCASTTNRNFEGRQGRGALTHIMSPAMVAAAAVHGRLSDARRM